MTDTDKLTAPIPWTHDKHKRIQRLTKRLEQVDEYLDRIHERNQDPDLITKTDSPVMNYELACLRKIAEELGDIPKSETQHDTNEPFNLYISGIDTDKL